LGALYLTRICGVKKGSADSQRCLGLWSRGAVLPLAESFARRGWRCRGSNALSGGTRAGPRAPTVLEF